MVNFNLHTNCTKRDAGYGDGSSVRIILPIDVEPNLALDPVVQNCDIVKDTLIGPKSHEQLPVYEQPCLKVSDKVITAWQSVDLMSNVVANQPNADGAAEWQRNTRAALCNPASFRHSTNSITGKPYKERVK